MRLQPLKRRFTPHIRRAAPLVPQLLLHAPSTAASTQKLVRDPVLVLVPPFLVVCSRDVGDVSLAEADMLGVTTRVVLRVVIMAGTVVLVGPRWLVVRFAEVAGVSRAAWSGILVMRAMVTRLAGLVRAILMG